MNLCKRIKDEDWHGYEEAKVVATDYFEYITGYEVPNQELHVSRNIDYWNVKFWFDDYQFEVVCKIDCHPPIRTLYIFTKKGFFKRFHVKSKKDIAQILEKECDV